jgi:hypothetical protein
MSHDTAYDFTFKYKSVRIAIVIQVSSDRIQEPERFSLLHQRIYAGVDVLRKISAVYCEQLCFVSLHKARKWRLGPVHVRICLTHDSSSESF